MSSIPVQPLHPCLVALQTATGAVTFIVTRHPAAQLEHLGQQIEVARSLVVTTAHAERLANELRSELAEKALTTFGSHPYFSVDWEDVERLVGEFDHATGLRMRRGDVAVGDHVQVDLTTANLGGGKRRGEVMGISGRRYLVRLEEPVGDFIGTWAPRSQIKPIRRACAIGEAA